MNILYISSKKRWGGVVNWMAKTAAGLGRKGHNVIIVSHPDSRLTKKSNPELNIIEKKLGPVFNPAAILFFVKLIKKNKIDLVVTNIDKEVGIGGIAAKLSGIPNIRRVGREDDFSDKFRYKYTHLLLVEKSIVPCNYIRDKVTEKYSWLKKEDFVTVYNGKVIPEIKEEDKKALKKKLNISENEKVIGITCQLSKIKHVDNLINAFYELQKADENLKLVIVGEGKEKENLTKLTETLKIRDKVIFAGYTKNVFLYDSIFDVATLVSESEGFPNSIVEYFAVGKAVVATDVGGNSEIIENNENGFLVPFGDKEALVEKIEILLKDAETRKRFEQNALETVKRKFTEEKMIDGVEKVFEDAIK